MASTTGDEPQYRRVGDEEEDDETSEGELVSNESSEELDDTAEPRQAPQLQPHIVLSRNRKANPALPDNTVTELQLTGFGPGGASGVEGPAEALLKAGRIFLIGTAHFSRESQEDVRRTVAETEPDLVMVELCRSRINVLELDEERLLKEASELGMDKVLAHIRAAGVVQGIMHILLVSMSANITRQLGMAPGGEFRAALKAAREVPGCQLDLGDRPVEITLQRAIGGLSVWKKLRLFFYILLSHSNTISPEDVEKCKEKDMLEQLLSELAGEFPELSRIFVSERDLFMAARLRSLLIALTQRKLQLAMDARAAEANVPLEEGELVDVDPVVIVAVVGMGHVPGITANFHRDDINVRDLLLVPPRSRLTTVVKYGMLGGLFGATVATTFLLVKGIRWTVSALSK